MVAKYPSQHSPWDGGGAGASGLSGDGGTKSFLPPPPPVVPLAPAATALGGGAGAALAWRIGLRAVPYVATGYALYTLWKWAGSLVVNDSDWVITTCTGGTPERWQTGTSSACGNRVFTNTAWAALGVGTPASPYNAAYTVYGNSQVADATHTSADRLWWASLKPGRTSADIYKKARYEVAFSYPSTFPEEFPILQPAGTPIPPKVKPGTGTPANPDGGEPDDATEPKPKPAINPHPDWPPIIITPGDVDFPDVVISPEPGVGFPLPGPGSGPGTDPGTGPGTGPDTGPGTDPGGSTDPGGGGQEKPPTYKDAPPSEKEKERKVRVRHGALHVAVNIATESLDFVDTLYKGMNLGLPKGERAHCKPHDYACKLKFLYEHADDPRFDAAKWVEAFINNQFEDYLYGKLGQQVGKATGNLGLSQGLNHALSKAQKAVEDYVDRVSKDNHLQGGGTLLPELVIDEVNGTAEIVWNPMGW